MKKKSRGEYEDAFTKAIIKFEREHFGRGPKDARTYLIGYMILIRLGGMLTSAESILAQEREGAELSKKPDANCWKARGRLSGKSFKIS